MKQLKGAAAGAAALAAVIAAVAYAAIPDSNGVIHACYSTGGLLQPAGTLRVIDSAAACRSGEIALNWNVKGPPGPRGLQGLQGLQGPAGPAGPGSIGDSLVIGGRTLPGCAISPVAQTPVHINTPTRIFVSVDGRYIHPPTNMTVVQTLVELYDASGTQVVASLPPQSTASPVADPVYGANIRTQGVLQEGTQVRLGSHPFIAPPGDYTLRWSLHPFQGQCVTANFEDGLVSAILLPGHESNP